MTTLTMDGWTDDFERINRHRAYAEFVIHNRNWLPWWIVTSITGDFCDQGERYLRGEGLPPLPVRLWWAYKHWRFRRGILRTSRGYLREHHKHKNRPTSVDMMQQSKITGDRFAPQKIIPVAPGQSIEFVPVVRDHGHEVSVLDMKTGKRRKVFIDNAMLANIADPRWREYMPDVPPEIRKAVWFSDNGDFEIDHATMQDLRRQWVELSREPIPNGIGDYPRPNCPKCHTPNPSLGTPLDPHSESGWGDSFFTCDNWKCRHKWKWKKTFPLLEENRNREGTKTGAKLKGTDIPFHFVSKCGVTIEQFNEGVRKFANVAGLANMTPQQRAKLAQIIQEDKHDGPCIFNGLPLVTVTNHETTSTQETHIEKTHHKNLRDGLTYVEYKRMHGHHKG